MPITEKTLQFLGENRLRDSRDWFNEHKSDYKELVEAPLLRLSAEVGAAIGDIDPGLTLEPRKTMSRVWRDVRFSRDKTVYREEMWLIFRRGSGMEFPAFFVELSPVFWRYGVGYYSAPPKVMEYIREMVQAGDKRWLAAQNALDKLPGFAVEGERFKRPRYPDAPERQREWLERRGLAVVKNEKEPGVLFTAELGETLAEAFRALAPVYDFLLAAHLRHLAENFAE